MTSKKSSEQKYHHGDLRRVLMDAALAMTRESGLASLSLREVARRIGVTTAAPYHHFKDRQSLLLELSIEAYAQLLEVLRHARDAAGSAEGGLEAAAAAYLNFGRTHRAQYSIMFSGEFATHPRAGEMIAVANQCLDLVRKSIAESSGLGAPEVVEAAFCAWSLLHGILMLDQNSVLMESPEEQERLAIRGVVGIVRGMRQGQSGSWGKMRPTAM